MPSRAALLVDNADLTAAPIAQPPTREQPETESSETQWVTHPDMHGNALLLIYRLMSCGALTNGLEEKTSGILFWKKTSTHSQYDILKRIYFDHDRAIHQIKHSKHHDPKITAIEKLKKDLAEFKRILSKIEVKNKAVAQRLIGDLLADRGANDYFTLLVLDHLKKNGVTVDIIFSNHDSAFIEAFEKGELAVHRSCERYIGEQGEGYSKSLDNLRTLLRERIITHKEITELVENSYKPQLKLISYDVCGDDFTFYTHAPVDFSVIADMAAFFKVDYNDDTQENFCHSIDLINAEFSKSVMNGNLKKLLDEDLRLRRNFEEKLSDDMKKISEDLLHIILKEKIQKKTSSEQEEFIQETIKAFHTVGPIAYVNAALEEQKNMSEEDINAAKAYISKLNELENTIEFGYCRTSPLYTFLWSRTENVAEVDDTKPNRSNLIASHYAWPKTGWKKKAVNAHGHTGQGSHVKKITEQETIPSDHFDNTDDSNFGKTKNTGKMIMHFSKNTRPYPAQKQESAWRAQP